MANRVKGITVEIGGDTTKLDKALAGTNKQLTTTQKSLKDVERLLKLDPGNTELLEQKQRLLAQAAEASAQRLDTLRQAAQSADKALQRGQAYQEKYEPLKAELDGVAASMKGLEANAASMQAKLEAGQISTEQYDAFNKKLQDTKKRHKELQQAVKDLDNEFKGARMDQSQYDALQRELAESEKKAKDAEDAFRKCASGMDEMGRKAQLVSDKTAELASSTKGISVAAGGAVGGLVAMAVNAGKSADDINTLAKQTGLSTEQIQKFQYATDIIDVSMDTLTGTMAKLIKNMANAQKGSGDAKAAFDALGISVVDQNGVLRDNQEVFDQAIEALGRMNDETQRDAYAMQIFGKSAQDLNPLILGGADALKQLGKEAEDAGLILSQDALDSANEFNDAIDSLKATATGTFASVGTEIATMLIPVMQDLGDGLKQIMEWFRGLDESQLNMIFTVGLVVGAISPALSLISKISNAMSGLLDVFSKLGAKGTIVLFAIGAILTIVTQLMSAWDDMSQFEKIVSVLGLIAAAAITAAIALGAFQSAATLGIAAAGIVAGIVAITAAINSANKRAERAAAYNKTMGIRSESGVPGLANGAVVPPNQPFFAMLGDNKKETEVVSPYSTIKQAAADAYAERGGTGDLHIYLHKGGGFMREFKFSLDGEAKRQGVKLTEV